MPRKFRLSLPVLMAIFCVALPARAQDALGTSFGIPGNAPAVNWPKGFSLENLGANRLYPNGPEFGLSNTSGGFGMIGSGRSSGIGLTQAALSGLPLEELDRPYVYTKRLTDIFAQESARSAFVFSTVLGAQFRTQIPRTPYSADLVHESLIMPSVDEVLQDRAARSDDILKASF